MIDATRSPRPLWKRIAMYAALAVLIIALGMLVWTKDLHHSSSASPPASPPAALSHSEAPAPAAHAPSATAPATISGGLAVSSRDPFAG